MADSAGVRVPPSAEGTLSARPLTHLLVYARARRLTGRLVLRASDGTGGAIALWRGQVAAVRTAPAHAYFGLVASEMRVVDPATAEATQREAAEKKQLHGEILIARGVITIAQRDAVLAEQACRKIRYLFGILPAATAFAYYEDAASAAEPALALDPIAPVWRALRDAAANDDLTTVLGPVMGKALRIVNEAPVARAGFTAEESALVDVLISRPMSLAQMRQGFPALPPALIDRLVYLLLITKSAEVASVSTAAMQAVTGVRGKVGSMDADAIAAALKLSLRPQASQASQAPKPLPTPSAAPPAAPSFAPARAGDAKPVLGPAELGAAGIALRAHAVDEEDPFQTLGLPGDASVDAARAAYFALVKLWHPDRMPASLAPVRAEVGKIFSAMTQAHHTLTDAGARQTFLAARAERAALLHRPRKDVLRLIDGSLAKKDFEYAGNESRKLLAGAPEDGEARALVAWIAASAGEGPEPAVRAAVLELDRALKQDPHCARAHFYRGVLHKRLGNASAAYRDFTHVVQLDPKHVDATREIRIHEMRMKK